MVYSILFILTSLASISTHNISNPVTITDFGGQSIQAETFNQHNLDESDHFRIIIDPGHGGKDHGCAHTDVPEKMITLPLALEIGNHLQKSNPHIEVIYTRKTDHTCLLYTSPSPRDRG